MFVIFHFKPMALYDSHLQVFQPGAVELNDFSAMQTDQMIVMRNVDVVLGITVCKLTFDGNASLNQKFQCAEDGRGVDLFPFFLKVRVQLIDSIVPVELEKLAHDELALWSQASFVQSYKLFKLLVRVVVHGILIAIALQLQKW